MSDDKPDLPIPRRSVLEELKGLFGDVHEDFGNSILVTDEELHTFFRQLTLDMMRSGRDINLMVDDFATNMYWMFLAGREHAARGFPSPLVRDDQEGSDLITDDQIRKLIESAQ